MKLIFTCLLLTLTVLFTVLTGCSKQDKVVMISDKDPEMDAAIAKARGSLPRFWEVFEKPEHGEINFSLKVPITDKRGTEFFWLINIERTNGQIFGTINNDPDIVKSVKNGDRITISEKDISDWLYMRDNKMFGNYTIRALFKKMSPEEAVQYKKMLAEP